MRNFKLCAAAALLATAGAASAATFTDIEPNDSVATAQLLVHDGSISLTGHREAIAENTYTDFFRFYAASGDALQLRLNVTSAGGDAYLRLLDGAGNFIAEDDDSGGYPNSLLNYNVGSTGYYIAAARGFGNSVYDYQLTVTGLTADPTFGSAGVPEPAAWAMMLGGFGLAGSAMRRRRRNLATA